MSKKIISATVVFAAAIGLSFVPGRVGAFAIEAGGAALTLIIFFTIDKLFGGK